MPTVRRFKGIVVKRTIAISLVTVNCGCGFEIQKRTWIVLYLMLVYCVKI